MRAAIADMRADQNQRRPAVLGLRFLNRYGDVFGIVSIEHGPSMPAVSFEPLGDVLGEIDLVAPAREM